MWSSLEIVCASARVKRNVDWIETLNWMLKRRRSPTCRRRLTTSNELLNKRLSKLIQSCHWWRVMTICSCTSVVSEPPLQVESCGNDEFILVVIEPPTSRSRSRVNSLRFFAIICVISGTWNGDAVHHRSCLVIPADLWIFPRDFSKELVRTGFKKLKKKKKKFGIPLPQTNVKKRKRIIWGKVHGTGRSRRVSLCVAVVITALPPLLILGREGGNARGKRRTIGGIVFFLTS